jgi:hypothetical protein
VKNTRHTVKKSGGFYSWERAEEEYPLQIVHIFYILNIATTCFLLKYRKGGLLLIGNKRIGQHEYNIRLLTGKDEPDVQDLCERCSDFFELTEGRPPGKDAGNLILDPNVRGSGLGRRLHDFIKD